MIRTGYTIDSPRAERASGRTDVRNAMKAMLRCALLAPLAIGRIVRHRRRAVVPRATPRHLARSAAQLEAAGGTDRALSALMAQLLMASNLSDGSARRRAVAGEFRVRRGARGSHADAAWSEVKALHPPPAAWQMMKTRLDGRRRWGATFYRRKQAVIEAIQRLRARAMPAGNLETTQQQKVARVVSAAEPGSNAPLTSYTIFY